MVVTIESRQVGDKTVLQVCGRMDAESTPVFDEQCQSWISRGATALIIDVGALEYVSSMGLRSFMLAGKLLKAKGGSLRVCCQKGLVKQVFEITRLDSVFPMHDSVEAALTAV